MKHYRDYFWNEGIPTGISSIAFPIDPAILNYKILSDPYHKWISIEQYLGEKFQSVIYDSRIFDFRSLKPTNQTAWNKVLFKSDQHSLIRNEDDRIILFEEYSFKANRCCMCKARSVHGIPVSTQIIYYIEFGDPFNGVVLYDNLNHPVMCKFYDIDDETGEFTDLKEEKWNMKSHAHLK